MKRILLFIIGVFSYTAYAQINCIYKVVNSTQSPQMGMPSNLEIELEVNQTPDYHLIETRFTNPKDGLGYSDDIKSVLINRKNNWVYAFDGNLSIVESYNLTTDTLVYSGTRAKYGSYTCEVYQVRNKPSVRVYCSKRLDININPGMRWFSEKATGGIARIEITRKESTLIYQLVKVSTVSRALDIYINKTLEYTNTPLDSRSILGN